MRKDWYLLVPLAVLVYMLFEGFTPMFAGMMGLALTAILILGSAIAASISATAFRVVFWFAMGLGAASFAKWGIHPVIALIAALVAINFFIKGGDKTLHTMKASLVDGARQALPVGVACAIVGVIIGVLTLTGAASSFAGYILTIGQKSLFASLLLTMLVCLVLGMGIPTIPNYIITSSIAAPALLKLGVPLIVSHMFVFYFGIMADLTPPVALAAFAASSIAKDSPMKIGVKATQIAIAGFVVPYMAVYDPALMVQGNWTALAVAYVVFKAVVAIVLWAVVAIGHLWRPVSWFGRAFAFVAAALLVAAVPLTDQAGFAMAAVFAVWQWARNRPRAVPA
jgi:TRAP transporter 4TM/12TM fusion protein